MKKIVWADGETMFEAPTQLECRRLVSEYLEANKLPPKCEMMTKQELDKYKKDKNLMQPKHVPKPVPEAEKPKPKA